MSDLISRLEEVGAGDLFDDAAQLVVDAAIARIEALEYEVAQLRKMTAEYCNTQLVMTIDRLSEKIKELEAGE